MARPATAIVLTAEDRHLLTQRVRAATTEQRAVVRAQVVLAAAHGDGTEAIAAALDLRPATVSKWRCRFAAHGLAGLADAPRRGPTRRYDAASEQRILKQLDAPPPSGHATWTGTLVARALGDVSSDEVWRVLRRHRIHLQRRRSWCISTDPEFAAKAADVVGLYLNPPENALVVSMDEKPSIQALE